MINQLERTQVKNVAEIFVDRANRSAPQLAITWFDQAGKQTSWSWSELADSVGRFTSALVDQGVSRGDPVVLISENRVEWIIADLAIQVLGAINVPFHSELTKEQACQLADHCLPRLILASSEQQAQKFDSLSRPTPIFTFDQIWCEKTDTCHPRDLSTLEKLAFQIQPTDLISILYTSGTTGEPKGVMLTHQNIVSNVDAKLATLPLGPGDVRLAILPLSHVFGRTCDLYTWIAAGCHLVLSQGWKRIWEELLEHRPTYINAVPYFYEKCYRLLADRDELSQPNAMSDLLGSRTKVLNCGGAPVADHVFEYFRENGLGLVTGYGLTETSPVATSSRLDSWKIGSVGKAIPGVEIKIAEDGEVLIRGDNLMKGYFKSPAATSEVLIDGWLHTGDLGRLDSEGFLFIVGRKKEMIVTAGGKNVAPIPIENALNAHPAIEQSFIYGDHQNFLTALIVPAEDWKPAFHPESEMASIIRNQLSSFSKYEQPGKFLILDEPFTIENGLLTAKKSLRRSNIVRHYHHLLESLSGGATDSVNFEI